MTASKPTHSRSDNSTPTAVLTTDAQRVIIALEQSQSRLWLQTLAARVDVTHPLAAILDSLVAADIVTRRRRDDGTHVILNDLRVAELRARRDL